MFNYYILLNIFNNNNNVPFKFTMWCPKYLKYFHTRALYRSCKNPDYALFHQHCGNLSITLKYSREPLVEDIFCT